MSLGLPPAPPVALLMGVSQAGLSFLGSSLAADIGQLSSAVAIGRLSACPDTCAMPHKTSVTAGCQHIFVMAKETTWRIYRKLLDLPRTTPIRDMMLPSSREGPQLLAQCAPLT